MSNHSKYAGMSPEELLAELDLLDVPVDLDKLADRLGINVSREFSLDKSHSGEIGVEGSVVNCWINPFDPSNRQRFTLAHEIGHYINDIADPLAYGRPVASFIDGNDSLRRDGRQHPSEYRANDFAARLLMPKNLVIREGKKIISEEKSRTGQKTVSKEVFFDLMSEKFEVSRQAMEIRLDNLGLLPKKR